MKVSPTGSNPIQNTEVSDASKTERSSRAQKTKKQTIDEGGDANISNRAKEFAKAKEVATAAPDIREKKIAELKKRIAEGKYKVDHEAVAERLVEEHLQTKDLG